VGNAKIVSLEVTTNPSSKEICLQIDTTPIDLHLVVVAEEPKSVLIDGTPMSKRLDPIGAPANSGWTWDEQSNVLKIFLTVKVSHTIVKIQ